MAIPMPRLPEGTRVKVVRADVPQDPRLTGRTGYVAVASDYATHALGVILDGDAQILWFMPQELEVTQELALPPEREAARRRRALP
jgi:hypothetical protein